VWFLLASALNTACLFHPRGTHTLPALGQLALAGAGFSADLRAMARTALRPVLLGGLGCVRRRTHAATARGAARPVAALWPQAPMQYA
jgi:hypothetical protein